MALPGLKEKVSTLDITFFKHSQLRAAKALKCENGWMGGGGTDVQALAVLCHLDVYRKILTCCHASI